MLTKKIPSEIQQVLKYLCTFLLILKIQVTEY